jgi:hypothetical protein
MYGLNKDKTLEIIKELNHSINKRILLNISSHRVWNQIKEI